MGLINYFRRMSAFVLRQQWMSDLHEVRRARRFGLGLLRTLTLATYEFIRNKCSLRASWLTLIFMFSLAPALALGFSVAKGFGAQDEVLHNIYRTVGITDDEGNIKPGAEMMKDVVDRMFAYARKTDVKALGLVGLLIILYTAYGVLSSIERTLNDIWAVQRRRTLMRRIIDYLAVLFVLPLMLILTALVMAALRTGPVQEAITRIMPGAVASMLAAVVALSSALLGLWFLYHFFPNARVRTASSFTGALVAAVCWAAVQYGFVRLQVGVAKYNAIYGTFAAIPIFLLWLQTSWMVILFGAEVSYAHAHLREFAYAGIGFQPSAAYREKVALGIMAVAAKRFACEQPPLTADDFSHQLAAPLRIVRETIENLRAEHLLAEMAGDPDAPNAYQPAVPLGQISVGRVLRAANQHGDDPAHVLPILERHGMHHVLAAREKCQAEFLATPILHFARTGSKQS